MSSRTVSFIALAISLLALALVVQGRLTNELRLEDGSNVVVIEPRGIVVRNKGATTNIEGGSVVATGTGLDGHPVGSAVYSGGFTLDGGKSVMSLTQSGLFMRAVEGGSETGPEVRLSPDAWTPPPRTKPFYPPEPGAANPTP